MRKSNWPTLLEKAIKQAEKKEFVRGIFDCSLASCDLIKAMTGNDPAKDFRGNYKTLKKAFSLIREKGGVDFESMVEIIFAIENFTEIPPLMGQRGDAVFIKQETGQALGIIDLSGKTVVFADIEQKYGFRKIELTNTMRVWRIE